MFGLSKKEKQQAIFQKNLADVLSAYLKSIHSPYECNAFIYDFRPLISLFDWSEIGVTNSAKDVLVGMCWSLLAAIPEGSLVVNSLRSSNRCKNWVPITVDLAEVLLPELEDQPDYQEKYQEFQHVVRKYGQNRFKA